MDRGRTTISDLEVVRRTLPAQVPCGWISDKDVVLFQRAPYGFPPTLFDSWQTAAGSNERAWVLLQVESKLRQFHDNWDGHFAKAPTEPAIQSATTLLDAVLPHLPMPEVSPSTDGGVILEWDSHEAEVLLIVEPSSQVEVSVCLDGFYSDGPFEEVQEELLLALKRIAANC